MLGLSSHGKEAINRIVEDLFDRVAMQLIGDIPRLKHKKLLIMGHQQNLGLAQLFVQAMKNRMPSPVEQDVLKGMLESSHGYIEALKNKTRSSLTESIDGLAREARLKDIKIDESTIQDLIEEQFSKARSHIETIIEAESTKVRNVGTMMDISRMASQSGEDDPLIYFVCVHDDSLCKECKRLHLMPDGITPRVWKFSELSYGYHKRGNDRPSILGLHPNERCVLTYIGKKFGFDKKGHITYKNDTYDIHKEQNKD